MVTLQMLGRNLLPKPILNLVWTNKTLLMEIQ